MTAFPFWPLTRAVVADTSMQPALRPGDGLIINRWASPHLGDIVLLRDPDYPKRMLVKRVAARTTEGHYIVRADNPNVGTDSRFFGAIPPALIVGKVVWRYRKR